MLTWYNEARKRGDLHERRNCFLQPRRRSAQIYKAEHVVDEGLVVAKDKDGKYSVFYEAAGTPDSKAKGDYKAVGKYTILAHL